MVKRQTKHWTRFRLDLSPEELGGGKEDTKRVYSETKETRIDSLF